MLRAIGRTRGLERIVAIGLRARLVRESTRFFWRELLPLAGRDGRRSYRLRGSGVPVVLEHRTPDAHTLAELWHQRVYEVPPGIDLAVLGAEPRVLDLGANVGMFAAWLIERGLRPRLVAYEPDPRNAERLRLALTALGDRLASWELRVGAVGSSERDLAFTPGAFAASRAEPGSPVTVRCWDVLPGLTQCDLVKLDVEGAEWEILRDPRLAHCSARIVVVEPHVVDGSPSDPVAGARALLEQAGYVTSVGAGTKGAADMVWGVRR